MKKSNAKPVIQRHHICYDPEVKQPMFQGEHWIITQMTRRRRLSLGFIISVLCHFLFRVNDIVDLNNLKEEETDELES